MKNFLSAIKLNHYKKIKREKHEIWNRFLPRKSITTKIELAKKKNYEIKIRSRKSLIFKEADQIFSSSKPMGAWFISLPSGNDSPHGCSR